MINSAGQPVVASTLITSAAFNSFTADAATGLSTCLLKDGTQTVTANIPMANFVLTGLGSGNASRTRSANTGDVQDNLANWCGTAGGTANALTLTPTPAITAYLAGQSFFFKAGASANTAATTVAISGLATIAVQVDGAACVGGEIQASKWYRVMLDTTSTCQLEQISSQPFLDTLPLIRGSADATKKVRFEVDGLTTATTRVITLPDADITLGGAVLAGTGVSVSGSTVSKIDETQMLENVGFTAAVAANALTFTLTQKDGTVLGAGSAAARIAFRNATLTTGQWTTIAVTSAITVVASSGSTLGMVSGVAARIYLLAINNAGSVELAMWNPLSGTNLLGINEAGVISTTAEGGAGAADSAQVAYSTTARSNVAVRVLGYIDISEATAGTWATAPTVLQIMGPGVNRTGDLIQRVYTSTGASATGTTTVPADDTIPQSSEGDQYMTLAVTPTSAVNLLEIDAQANLSHSVASIRMMTSLYQDATANALTTVQTFSTASGAVLNDPPHLLYQMNAGTTSATTFKIRAGSSSAGTTTFNGEATARLYGGVLNSYMKITETCL